MADSFTQASQMLDILDRLNSDGVDQTTIAVSQAVSAKYMPVILEAVDGFKAIGEDPRDWIAQQPGASKRRVDDAKLERMLLENRMFAAEVALAEQAAGLTQRVS